MLDSSKRKTVFILALAFSLAVALVAIVTDDELRNRLGSRYYVISLSIIGCVLLVLAGYVWDRTLLKRLHTLNASVPVNDAKNGGHDDVISLARSIERMAQSLQKTEASYRGIVEDQIDLICRYRPDGVVTFANRAYAEAIGRNRVETNGVPFVLAREDAVRELDSWTVEQPMEFAGGGRRWILWTLRSIRDPQDRTIEYQAVGHDITLRKEAEAASHAAKEAAQAADRAKSEFLAMVSHEIRTPIGGVLGFAQILAETPLTPEQREHVAIIRSSALALQKLIADILDLSKMEAGKIDIEPAPFGLHKCVDEVVSFFQPKARHAGLRLTTHIANDVPAIVNTDESRLRQILTNLIGNAVKFTERGSITVHVTCARAPAGGADELHLPVRLFFAISDTGIGIPAEKVGRLFKPFSQVDASTARRRNGTGLGLLISKQLCELMGGSISVESQPGQGSTFRFSLLADYQKGDTAPPFTRTRAVVV